MFNINWHHPFSCIYSIYVKRCFNISYFVWFLHHKISTYLALLGEELDSSMYCYFILLIIQQVLDAPELQDDFYLNLVDWSSQNVLSVGLGSCVYLWSACTSQVTRLCDLSSDNNSVTSVAWSERVSVI